MQTRYIIALDLIDLKIIEKRSEKFVTKNYFGV